jgi:hypothetical protein
MRLIVFFEVRSKDLLALGLDVAPEGQVLVVGEALA